MREYGGLDTVAGTQFRQDMRHMGLDGRLGEEKLGCDFGVGQTTGHRAQNVELAAGQVGQPGDGGLPGTLSDVAVYQPREHGGAKFTAVWRHLPSPDAGELVDLSSHDSDVRRDSWDDLPGGAAAYAEA